MRRIPNTESKVEIRQAFERIINDTGALSTGGASGYVLIGAGLGNPPVWTTSLTALTLLTVDNITINGAVITSDTGTIGFDNENLTTTGTITGVNVTSGTNPGHYHTGAYVLLSTVGSPTYTNVQQMQDIFHSAGWVSGGTITDNGDGTVSITAGTGLIRTSASAVATIAFFDWIALNNQAITDATTRYIGVEYNAGSPQISVRTSENWNYFTDFPLGEVTREGSVIHVTAHRQGVGDHANNMIQRMHGTDHIERDNRAGGLILGETGTRNVTVTAGYLWVGLTKFTIAAIDTSVASTFDRYYRDGAGGWTKQAAQTQWNNTQYDDGDGGLATLTGLFYSAQYFYLEPDGNLVSLFGWNQYSNIASALDDPSPSSVPARLSAHGLLIGRIIFQASAATATSIQTIFDTEFTQSLVSDHGNLAGLADDDHTQYHNDTRGDARYYTETELDAGQLDNRYYRENEHISTSAGVADAGKPIVLNASGLVDGTMVLTVSDHGALTGLTDDDHAQYLLISGARAMTGQLNCSTFGLTTTGGIASAEIIATKTWTSYVSDAYGVQVSSTVNTGWLVGWNYGFYSQGFCNGNVGDASMQVMGGIGRGYFQSSGTLGWLIGLKGDCYIYNAAASGTVSNAISFYAQYFAYGGGATATVTNAYAFYAEDRTVGGTRWAYYHTGTDNSRIGGRFGIGTNPTAMLDVSLSEAGTAARQDAVNVGYTNTGTNSYNSIGRGVQILYFLPTAGIATNYNGLWMALQTANAATSNIGTMCGIQMYTGYGYHASATVGSAIGVWIKGWGNQVPGTFTTHYGIKIDAIAGASTNYAILTAGGHVILNENGTASITRVEGDNDANLLYVDGVNDKVGVGTASPNGKFDVNTSFAGTANEQNLITGGLTQTGSNTYNSEGRGTQGLYVDLISHGATNVNGVYIKPRLDNNFTVGTCCGIQLYSIFGEDGAGCTLTTAIGVYIKGLGGTTPATFTNHYGLKIDRITGAASLNYAIHTTGGEIVFNDGGFGDSDVRMESDLDANCFFLDTSANNICIGGTDPQVRLDIVNAASNVGLRIRNSKTPASAAAAGNQGDICWDSDYIYVCTATNTWKKALIATWV